jgi:hypothetical protein
MALLKLWLEGICIVTIFLKIGGVLLYRRLFRVVHREDIPGLIDIFLAIDRKSGAVGFIIDTPASIINIIKKSHCYELSVTVIDEELHRVVEFMDRRELIYSQSNGRPGNTVLSSRNFPRPWIKSSVLDLVEQLLPEKSDVRIRAMRMF